MPSLEPEHATLADRAEILARLAAFARSVMGILPPDQLWAQLVDGVAGVLPADIVALTVLDRPTGRYELRAVRGVDPSVIGSEVRPGEGVTGRAIRDRALVVIDRLPKDAFPAAVHNATDVTQLVAIGVPLIREDTVLGALMIGRTDLDRPFSVVERDALELLATQAALAIANAFLHAEVAELAIRDPLTGLHNRRFLDTTLVRLEASRRRFGSDDRRPVAAVLFDLDHFGRFNKDHGHQAGDAALRAFAELLSGRLRASDMVARYGGEEFVVILDGAGLDAAVAVADEVRRGFESRALLGRDGAAVHATVSAGVAELNGDEASFEDLLRSADAGLLLAKRAGRNRVASA